MTRTIISPAPLSRGSRYLKILAMSVLMATATCYPAYANPTEADARIAITRAQAKVDLVSREYPAATQDASFSVAQRKLAEANAAIKRNKQDAVWLAMEAELMADTTAGTSKLAGLERTRSEVARNIEILEIELRQ